MSIRKEPPPHGKFSDRAGAIGALIDDLGSRTIDRRVLLARIGAVLALTAAAPRPVRSGTPTDDTAVANNDPLFSEEPWQTLSAVHDHLFPTTAGAPGAKEINATAYLQRMWAEPDMDPDNREFIPNGVGWLNDIAHQRHEATFAELNEEQREGVLRQIEKTGAGERWLSLILVYIFEALLSDPVYGGNPDQIGWRWLEHRPGFPRPSAEQTYRKL